MVMTTVHIAIAPSKPRSRPRVSKGVGSLVDVVRLSIVAALVYAGGAIGAGVAFASLTGVGGSWAILAAFVLPGAGFLAAIAAATLIWLLGAIGTRRTIRRLAPLHELEDRAAIAELAALLARE